MEDVQILELYWKRSEDAIEQTEKKYRRYCHYIACRILSDDEDAKEIVNETFLKAWHTIPPKRPTSLKAYVGTICRHLALDLYEAKHAKKRSGQVALVLDELNECLPDSEDGTAYADRLALREALNSFLRSLPDKTQRIFVRRYWYVSPIAEIAKDFAMKESSVTVLLLRTRKKLKAFLNKEGFNV